MILLFRCILIIIYSLIVCFFGILYCIIKPKNKNHVFNFINLFGYILKFLGITIKTRKSKISFLCNHGIYICNHQSYYDMLTVSNVIKPNVFAIGKKSVLLVPFFGLLYWLAGNFTINRNNVKKSHRALKNIFQIVKKKKFLFGFSQKGKEVWD